MHKTIVCWGVIIFCWATWASAATKADPNLPEYVATDNVHGRLTSIGSDTLAPAMKRWVRTFIRFYPHAAISMRASGSSLAPPALTSGKAQLGPMSRPMKPSEIAKFHQAHGYDPTAIQVAYDALTVYVNYRNPLQNLTIAQLNAVFSDDRRCGHPEEIATWGDLGLEGDWSDMPIQLYGRDSSSGTYGFFQSKALCDGDYKASMTARRGNLSLVQSIVMKKGAVGYAGVSFKRIESLKALPLAANDGSEFVDANTENALNGSYPLVRPLFIYIDKKPGHPASRTTTEFLRMVLSRVGQQAVDKSGYIPLPADIAKRELAKLEK